MAALDAFRPTGEVLELACGTGAWTAQLLRHADTVTAVDASPEMLELAGRRVADDPRVRFVVADIFTWRPERRYDVVFFGLWISHVPMERFDAFWKFVDGCLAPRGRVFFADDAYRTEDELIEGRNRRRSSVGSKTTPAFEWSRFPTPSPASSAGCTSSGGGSRSTRRRSVLLGSRHARRERGS